MESIEEIECDTCRNIWMRYATLEAHLFYNLIESILNPEAYGIDDDARGHLEKYYWEASADLILFTQWQITGHVHDAGRQNVPHSLIVQLAEKYALQKSRRMKH